MSRSIPIPAEELEANEVSALVNSPRKDSPDRRALASAET